MAPHALAAESDAASSLVAASNSDSAALLKANPFGTLVDPSSLRGVAYTSPAAIINQTVYAISSKIFSYETPGAPNLLDHHVQLWAQNYQRPNSFGVVPFFHQLQVRSGASNALLGYYSKNGTNGQPLSVLLASNALSYMQPALAAKSAASLPLALNVSAIDYDSVSNSLCSNYITSLSAARSLGYSVVTPVNLRDAAELQHLTVLNHYLAALTGTPSIHLFDGPEAAKTFTKFAGVASLDIVGHLYQSLLNSKAEFSSLDQAVAVAFESLNALTGKNYSFFEYAGHQSPDTVFVVYGSHESTELSTIVEKVASGAKIGLIKVRVPLPFNQAEFIKTVPKSTKRLVVLSQVSHDNQVSSSLKADITAALFLGGVYHNLSIEEFNYPLSFLWTPVTITKILNEFVSSLNPDLALLSAPSAPAADITANTSPEGKFLFWGKDDGLFLKNADKIALSLSLDDSKAVQIRNKFDNSNGGGLFQSQIVSAASSSNISSVDSADLVVLEDLSILNSYDVLATAKPGATILYISHKPITSIDEDVIPKLPLEFKRSLASNHNKLTLVDFSLIDELDAINSATSGLTSDFFIQLAFWRASLPELGGFIVNKLLQANGNDFELLAVVLDKFINTVDEKNGLREIPVLPEWVDLKEEVPEDQEKDEASKDSEEKKEEEKVEEEEEEVVLPFFPVESSFFPNPRLSNEGIEETTLGGYKELATKLAFSEAFNVKKELRPDLPVKNFVVKVQENKRLTPQEYSRNIFHIEFDTTGTGMKYEIGEALGIHGRNNSEEVEKFLEFYGVDGDDVVEVSNRDDASILEIRSARQTLAENVDFLGKPPKRFYEALAEYAEDDTEKSHLEKLASGEGAAELKKRQDVDFDTYVDVLEEFKSARPGFADLVKIIAPLKRREYSIASSQRMHPNAVHLLIVVVDWVDPRGRTRFGHCSKYLSDLKIGDELVVSVKPSVMKLPPLSTQPIVMSGLGTGLAPFKAFIEEKIWQEQQGLEIGEIYLYMGSRHKKEEYLYGELWEAYKDAGLLTHIGAAFSRDQPQKIYIQDKIRESIEELTDAIVTKNGSFYLCGPTWPVPDITACLEDIVQNGAKRAGTEIKEVAKVVEDMKEEGRYILEVY
ncbi:uncharacterized protein CANTADRAFT_24880 [Suhomyces tanzawaensis NRRL Y-17324]|uniref:assimilatory sulfite reductase (NADPH) n=1 Tax=Suhomyces tanzawaensis NRRL Y-17324 TaxID=984487 RepID=A0A1E4SS43_9ASCO|nr:uncharacterized protein CANTADRAFT_24880 [Suhomyces tanzawaensis NRRL Y-17324]ODV82315.1 hypothetical protein CANTADRAFT_24880 [Suhomyces tanzawaensis NRRL Y-17324]